MTTLSKTKQQTISESMEDRLWNLGYLSRTQCGQLSEIIRQEKQKSFEEAVEKTIEVFRQTVSVESYEWDGVKSNEEEIIQKLQSLLKQQ